MHKIPTIFERDWDGDRSRVTSVVNNECLWVFQGEGRATRKFDGTAVMIRAGELFVRYDAKNGKKPPANFIPAQEAYDPETGHWPGWVPAGLDPQYKWQRAAFNRETCLPDGTYEAIGPHIRSNPEQAETEVLIPHGQEVLSDVPLTWAEMRDWFADKNIEGIVWHHPDGRMAKIKKRDFGLERRPSGNSNP